MQVTGFEVFPVVCPPPFRGGRSWLFVRLDTDAGTRGYGEMMLLGVGFRLPVLAAMMADVIEQAVLGHDPYDTEMLFDKVYGRAGYSVYGGPLIAAAALHLSLCSPNFLIMEAVERFDGVHAQFTEERFDWQDGYLLPPRGPGLGFTLREDVARRHAPQGPQPGTIRSY
jgi:L-alanine-DL-glutamate epimerase-like enolase superfamily enzyme